MSRFFGRTFIHPAYDYLLIGGGLSLVVIPIVWFASSGEAMLDFQLLPWFILFSNSAHFAASTVRLYTKPGAQQSLPFVTLMLPFVAIAILTLSLFWAEDLGKYFQVLYLTWSPYHYAAQAYGLAVMYCYRSGCVLAASEKRLLWWSAVLPFFKVALVTLDKHVLWWILPSAWLWEDSAWSSWLPQAAEMIGYLAIVVPLVLYFLYWKRSSRPVPLISLMTILTNAVWFVAFSYLNAFVWSTIFHGIQYLAIVIIFHVRDQVARPDNRHGRLYHVLWFYLASVLLGYGLFNCWPQGYVLMGFGAAESVLLVIAAINIHHFIVDAFIWKLQKGDSNRAIVDSHSVV